jgi:hypothetical protein
VQQLRSQYPTPEAWAQVLGQYKLTETDIAEHIRDELHILRFVDIRLRSGVHVEAAAIETYYREKLLPEVKKSNAPEPPLAQVAAKIEEILVQQHLDELVSTYLTDLRRHAHIRMEVKSFEPPVPGQPFGSRRAWVSVPANGGR